MSDNQFKYAKADESPGFLLFKLIGVWQLKLNEIFSEFGITQTQYAIMASLLWMETQDNVRHVTQTKLVDHTKLDKMTLSKAIRSLETKDFIKRFQAEHDSRAIIIEFSTSGLKLIKKAIKMVEECDENFFKYLNEQELENFKSGMITLVEKNS